MLMALKQLGDQLRKRSITDFRYYLTLDRLSRTSKIICIDFEWDDKTAHYKGVHLEDYDAEKGEQVLYSSGPSRGGDYSPTSIITKPSSTIKRIFEYGWFKKVTTENSLVKALKQAFNIEKKQIIEDVTNEYAELDGDEKRNCLLTLKIWKNKKAQFLTAYDIFRKAVKENVLQSWVEKYGAKSQGITTCAICHKEQEVVGYGFPFPFRSFDKLGFAPNLQQKFAWKQLPLCKNCVYSLTAAKSFLEKNAFSFGKGIQYYIIPDFPVKSPTKNIIDRILVGKKSETEIYLVSTDEYYTYLSVDEELPPMRMAFLFFSKPQQSQLLIEKYVEDVSPSWLKQLYEYEKQIEQKFLFQEESLKKIISKKWMGNWKFETFNRMLWKILPNAEQLFDPKEAALELIKRILRREPVKYAHLMRLFALETQRRYINEQANQSVKLLESSLAHSLNTFMFLCFLYECGLLHGMESPEMPTTGVIIVDSKEKEVVEFIESHGSAFDSAEKRAVFLEGVLTSKLLQRQYAERGSAPFHSKLRGLRLDVSRIKKLLSDIEIKMAAYNLYYPDLKELLSRSMLDAESNGWDISRDEIVYFFTLGMNLGRLFKRR